MRNWYDYILKKEKKDNLNRFDYTNKTLFESKDFNKYFKKKFFVKLEYAYSSFNYFNKTLNKKQEVFCIGSGWAHMEYFLSNSYKIIASDYYKKYVDFFKKKRKKNFRYLKFDILKDKQQMKKKNYDQIIVNSIEYLFNDQQMKILLKNLRKLGNKNTDFYLIFRSRDGFIIKIIDKYLALLEKKIFQLIKKINGENYILTKNHHGFRRYMYEFLNLLKNNDCRIISVHEDLYQTEYNRLGVIRKLKLSKILSLVFLKSHPYLNIIKFKFKV